jgi:NADH-quinone oxidoreductase subunit G
MPTLTIDGQAFPYEGKKMILQVAQENGYEIPAYCYHPGLSIVASCRICLAEVAQPNPRNNNKLELIPKLMPTCQTPAADGMVVYTKSPKTVANQKAVMEYLLINHPLDCPVCDQAGECSLQDYSFKYGRSESRFEEEKIKQPVKDIGPNVKLYSDRCIMCSRCVRFTREVSGTSEIAVFGRGATEQIDVFPGVPLANELSANVVDLCPVGALLDKDFLFTQRVWFLKETPSIDGITASGDNITIHHNDGQVYRVKPRTNMEVNKWWISDEIRYGWKFVHAENRLHRPVRQQMGGAVESDWTHAIHDAAHGLRQATPLPPREGPEEGRANETPAGSNRPSIAVIVSPMLSIEEAYLLAKLARTLDPAALLIIGPIPRAGDDKTFPGGYTVSAEKCPNSRGVRRALERVAGDAAAVLSYDAGVAKLGEKNTTVKAAIITGGFPSQWTTKEITAAVKGKFTVVLDVLPSELTEKADVVLPGATWTEKNGTFENAKGRLQSFEQAIAVLEGARTEGQIALDLMAACGFGPPARYDAATVRDEIGGVMISAVKSPVHQHEAVPDLQYVEL